MFDSWHDGHETDQQEIIDKVMSDESEVVLCPECLFKTTGKLGHRKCTNPLCGAEVDESDWPEIKGFGDLAPWSAANLIPPADGSAYTMPELQEVTVNGFLRERTQFVFFEDQEVVYIGSSYKAHVEIEGAAPLHAALLRHRGTGDWWIYDCGCSSGTFVQGRRVHCRKLNRGDIITIAGVELMFKGDWLDSNVKEEKGLSLRVEDLNFRIPDSENSNSEDGMKSILRDVSFEVHPGEFIGILGPSGCGKSSLVQRLIGLPGGEHSEVSGRILANGIAIGECMTAYRLATSYLPQNVNETLHDALTLEDEIDIFRRIHVRDSEDDDENRENILRKLDLVDRRLRGRAVGPFSGGQKRRVGIALSLLRRPKLLLMDEPGAGLDPATEKRLMHHLRDIADKGRTVLCVTHLLEHKDLFSRILILSKNGEVVYFGVPQNVCKTFDVSTIDELYHRLDRNEIPVRYDGLDSSASEQEEFPEVERAPFVSVVCGYFVRFFKEFVKGGMLPAKFLVGYPLVLIIGIRLACACYFRANGGKPVPGFNTFAFCAALAMFWLGINYAARSLVSERIPGRCLENLNQVPLSAYLTSKLTWTIILCACQALSFTALLCIAGRFQVPLEKAIESPCLEVSALWVVPLFVSCLSGALWGLAVSAISKVELTAISWVPNLAILALLFSKTLIRFGYDTFYSPIAKFFATKIMPCHWPSVVMENFQSGVSDAAAIGAMIVQLVLYAVISVALICFYQRQNENAWSGR